jgi:hypothetical protein
MSGEKLIQLRGGLSTTWQTVNPVLEFREVGLETDTRRQKVGDGFTPWNSLPYFGLTQEDLQAALADFVTAVYARTTDPNVAGTPWNNAGVWTFSAGSASPSLDFSVSTNSQYIGSLN